LQPVAGLLAAFELYLKCRYATDVLMPVLAPAGELLFFA